MRLLVIVVVYNGMQWLEKCLSSVVGSTVKADLFIVDNGSTDGSREYVEKHFPDSVRIWSEENLCFGRANNLGLQHALDNGYEYVYLLNQDAWVSPDTFEILIETATKNSKYGILSPLQTNREGTKLDKVFALYTPHEVASDALCSEIKSLYPVRFIMAAHWLLTREAIKAVGGFSPTFPHYGEDDNYIDRLKYRGYEVGIVTTTRAVHDREFRTVSPQHLQYMKYIQVLKFLSRPTTKVNFLSQCKFLSLDLPYRIELNAKYRWRIFREFRSIMRNRELEFTQCAFLRDE